MRGKAGMKGQARVTARQEDLDKALDKAFQRLSNLMDKQQEADHALAREMQQAEVGRLTVLLRNCACAY